MTVGRHPQRWRTAQRHQNDIANRRYSEGMRIGRKLQTIAERAEEHAAYNRDSNGATDLQRRHDDSRGEPGVTLINAAA